MEKKRLLGMTLEELKAAVTEIGLPAFAAKQVARWIYVLYRRDDEHISEEPRGFKGALHHWLYRPYRLPT